MPSSSGYSRCPVKTGGSSRRQELARCGMQTVRCGNPRGARRAGLSLLRIFPTARIDALGVISFNKLDALAFYLLLGVNYIPRDVAVRLS